MKHRISMLWPDGLKKAVTFSYDDGVMQDLRLTALFRRYGLKATFNLNSGFFGQIDSSLQRGREIDHSHVPEEDVACVYAGFECAVHTAHHPWLTQLSAVNAAEEILSDRAAIEAVIKQPVRGMAYPFGAVNAHAASSTPGARGSREILPCPRTRTTGAVPAITARWSR